MPSAFAHAVSAAAIGGWFNYPGKPWKFWLLAIFCSAIPDADVITFAFNIPYEHWLGHRGFFHSITFAVILGVLVTFLFYRTTSLLSSQGIGLICVFTLCTFSHGILDMLTSGGEGIALFAPFDNTRYFFSFRPIQVSPIGASKFFSEWGIRVLKSEAIWIGLPSAGIIICRIIFRSLSKTDQNNQNSS